MATKTGLKDKLVGKTKEVIAEITGDGKLADEGKRQAENKRPDRPPDPSEEAGPFDRLNQLT